MVVRVCISVGDYHTRSIVPHFGRQSFMSQDLRGYIDLIREKKLLLDIKKEVDPLTNLAGIAYRGENERGKATMFHNLKDYPGWTAVSYLCGSREKMALGLGTTKDKALVELGGRIS